MKKNGFNKKYSNGIILLLMLLVVVSFISRKNIDKIENKNINTTTKNKVIDSSILNSEKNETTTTKKIKTETTAVVFTKNTTTTIKLIPIITTTLSKDIVEKESKGLVDYGLWYTSSYRTAKYYYHESCEGGQGLSKQYLDSFEKEEDLIRKYDRILHPECIPKK